MYKRQAVPVPILHEFKADNIHHIVNHSEAKLLFVGDIVWEDLNETLMKNLKGIFLLNDFSLLRSKSEKLTDMRNRLNEYFGKKYPARFTPDAVSYYEDSPEELAVINYTSGSTGFSKGVMLPYRSLWSNVKFCLDHLPFLSAGDGIVCMLPMEMCIRDSPYNAYRHLLPARDSTCKIYHIQFYRLYSRCRQ